MPRDFIWRRVHSFTGLFLTLYIILHLFTNSQAALFFGDYGKNFVKSVNKIHEIPYLIVIEFVLLGLPILIHAAWGIAYIREAKFNSYGNDGKHSYLPYSRNRAFTWQRLTAWILLFGIAAHVIHMRVLEYPVIVEKAHKEWYMVRVSEDPGVYALKDRLGYEIFSEKQISELDENNAFAAALKKKSLKKNEVIIAADNFGTSTLMMLRNTFKSPLMIALYTIFTLAATFHGFNGLWTAMISCGITLTAKSQRLMLNLSLFLMLVVTFLGLSAIFLTYWVTLRR